MGRKKKQPVEEGASKKKSTTDDLLWDKAEKLLSSEYGKDVLQTFEQLTSKNVEGISTGSLALDYAINPKLGGMPRGRVIEIYGPHSGGKTTLALGVCANATANKLKVVFIDAEASLTPELIKNSGIDTEYFRCTTEMDGRITANLAETLMKTGKVGVVVVDSLPAWRPIPDPKKGKDEADFTRPQMAYKSSFHGEVLPRLASVARQYNVILLLLNQVRQNISGYGNPSKPFGGEVVKHTDSVRIKCTGNASSSNERIQDSDGNLVGQYTTCVVDKNKTALPMGVARLPLFLGRGVNPYMEVATLAQQVGIVTGASGWFKWADSDDVIAHGIDNFTQTLFDDDDLYKKLRKEVISRLGLTYPKDKIIINSFHDENLKKYSDLVEDK